jgi:hypothetical protein
MIFSYIDLRYFGQIHPIYYTFLPSFKNFHGFHYSIFIHVYEVLWSHSLSPLTHPSSLWFPQPTSPPFNTHIIHLFLGEDFTYEREHLIPVFLSLPYFITLTWGFPIHIFFCKKHNFILPSVWITLIYKCKVFSVHQLIDS